MRQKIRIISLSLFCGLALMSCNKKETVTGTVRDLGPVELDGCGWVILVGSETFRPTNLSSEFQQDQLEVEISFSETGNMFPCGLQPNTFAEIEIDEIN